MKFLKGISEIQWGIIDYREAWDSDMKAKLVDWLTEIVHVVSTVALERIFSTSNRAVVTNVLDNVNISLGDSISGSFALALQVPQHECDSAVMLTALVESEVT